MCVCGGVISLLLSTDDNITNEGDIGEDQQTICYPVMLNNKTAF